MGLASDLGYSHHTSNPLFRLVRSFAGTAVGAKVFSHTLRYLDTFVARVTKGRQSTPGLLAGLAVLDVTTTGRKSGQQRTSHLIAAPYEDDLALLGTNFGQTSTPAWALNLEADPQATVTYRGQTRSVVARPATAEEADRIFDAAGTFYPGYQHYRRRIGDSRRIRVFVLTET
jgi:deazaflavin-dependent oxidoreductase (nitroreductase family)